MIRTPVRATLLVPQHLGICRIRGMYTLPKTNVESSKMGFLGTYKVMWESIGDMWGH